LDYEGRVLAARALAARVGVDLVRRSPGGARNVTSSIRRTIVRLRDLPRLGKPTDEAGVLVESGDGKKRLYFVANSHKMNDKRVEANETDFGDIFLNMGQRKIILRSLFSVPAMED
jgi:hypothetical protein